MASIKLQPQHCSGLVVFWTRCPIFILKRKAPTEVTNKCGSLQFLRFFFPKVEERTKNQVTQVHIVLMIKSVDVELYRLKKSQRLKLRWQSNSVNIASSCDFLLIQLCIVINITTIWTGILCKILHLFFHSKCTFYHTTYFKVSAIEYFFLTLWLSLPVKFWLVISLASLWT